MSFLNGENRYVAISSYRQRLHVFAVKMAAGSAWKSRFNRWNGSPIALLNRDTSFSFSMEKRDETAIEKYRFPVGDIVHRHVEDNLAGIFDTRRG